MLLIFNDMIFNDVIFQVAVVKLKDTGLCY